MLKSRYQAMDQEVEMDHLEQNLNPIHNKK